MFRSTTLKFALTTSMLLTPISALYAQNNNNTPEIADFQAEQITVFVDFGSLGERGTFTVNELPNRRQFYGTYANIPYSAADKQEIIRRLEDDYESFNINFTLDKPVTGDFETLAINNVPGINIFFDANTQDVLVRYGTTLLTPSLDILNRFDGETAAASGQLWDFLAQEDPSGELFSQISGISITTTLEDAVTQAKINTISNIGAHELGHLLGLGHHDGFSPVGLGLDPLPTIAENESFFPPYTGPRNATSTVFRVMSSGSAPSVHARVNQTFSDRSLLKLAAANQLSATVETEESADGQIIMLKPITLPGERSIIRDPDILLIQRAVNIQGSLDELGEEDFYTFTGDAGEFITIETFGRRTIERAADVEITLFYESPEGGRVQIDTNDLSFEGRESLLIDVPLPQTGQYTLRVRSANASRSLSGIFRNSVSNFFKIGDYEALIYSSKRIDAS